MASTDRALSVQDIVYAVLQYFPPSSLQLLKPVSRTFLAACTLHQRRCARSLLGCLSPALAHSVEAEIYACCGGRSGPGAYSAKFRQLSTSLRLNAQLAQRLQNGSLLPASFVRLSPQQLRTAQAEQHVAAVMQAALERRKVPERHANFFSKACPGCGGCRLLRESFLVWGSEDPTKAHTRFTCVTCNRAVEVSPEEAFGQLRGHKRPREGEAEGEGRVEAAEEAEEEEEEEEEEHIDLSGYFLTNRNFK